MTTRRFVEQFGLDTLRDLPDIEALEDAGLLRGVGEGSDMMSMPVQHDEERSDLME